MNNDRFFKFFPTPDYLKMPISSVHISDNYISFLEMSMNESSFVLNKYGKKDLPEGAVKAGFINDNEKVSEVLNLIREENQLKFIISSLPEEKSYLFKTEIPNLNNEDDIRSALEFKIEENVPISLSKAVFDYNLIGKKDKIKDVIVSVLPIKTVEAFMNVFKKAELVPVSFGLESGAISRAVIKNDDDSVFIIINLGKNKTGLYIINNNIVHFTSTVAIGSDHIFDSKIRKKEEAGLKDEIEKLFSYWCFYREKSKNSVNNIEKIILCGEKSHNNELINYIQKDFNIEVDLANVWTNVFDFEKEIPDIVYEDSFIYAVPIGLNLFKFDKLN